MITISNYSNAPIEEEDMGNNFRTSNQNQSTIQNTKQMDLKQNQGPFVKGTLLCVKDSVRKWCLGKINNTTAKSIQISFIGWSSKWDEWIDFNDVPQRVCFGQPSIQIGDKEFKVGDMVFIKKNVVKIEFICSHSIYSIAPNGKCDVHTVSDIINSHMLHEIYEKYKDIKNDIFLKVGDMIEVKIDTNWEFGKVIEVFDQHMMHVFVLRLDRVETISMYDASKWHISDSIAKIQGLNLLKDISQTMRDMFEFQMGLQRFQQFQERQGQEQDENKEADDILGL